MKKILKLTLALGLAGAVFAPSIKDAHAEYSYKSYYTISQNYDNLVKETKKLIDADTDFRNSYRFLNASYTYRDNYKTAYSDAYYRLYSAVSYYPTETDLKVLTEAYQKLVKARDNINPYSTIDDGRVDKEELTKLIKEFDDFTKTDAYKKASKTTQDRYYNAVNYANERIKVTDGRLYLSEYNKLVKDIKDAKETINQVYKSTVLDDLISEYDKFRKSDEYKAASESQQWDYYYAVKEANDKSKPMLTGEYERLVKKIQDAKDAITKSYTNNTLLASLKKEIDESSPLRNKASEYTKESFDSFISSLKYAETVYEDKSSKRSKDEYKEITDSLAKARKALVKSKNEAVEAQIKKLEEAIRRNGEAKKAAELLFKLAPKTVEPIKGKLNDLIKDSEKTLAEANKVLAKLKGIKG